MSENNNLEWVKTEEGNAEYLLWMQDLVDRAKKIVPTIPISLTKEGELLIDINMDYAELPLSIKNNPNFYKNGATSFQVEYKIKNIILEEIDIIAQKRKALSNTDEDDESEFLYSDEEIYKMIEVAIVKDICDKALKARMFAIQSFESATGFVVKNENGINHIVPLFSEEEVKEKVKEKHGFFHKLAEHLWKWYNGC